MKKYYAILNLESNTIDVIVRVKNEEEVKKKIIKNKKYWTLFIDQDTKNTEFAIKKFITAPQNSQIEINEVVLIK